MKKQDAWLYVIGAVALIFIVLVLSMYFIHFTRLSTDTTVWGTFGDYVGGSLNPLLSFLALIALLYTIRLQKRQLNETEDANKEQAKYMALSAKISAYIGAVQAHNVMVEQSQKIMELGNMECLALDHSKLIGKQKELIVKLFSLINELEELTPKPDLKNPT